VLVRDVGQEDAGCGEMGIAIVDPACETRLVDQLGKNVDYRPASLSELFRALSDTRMTYRATAAL